MQFAPHERKQHSIQMKKRDLGGARADPWQKDDDPWRHPRAQVEWNMIAKVGSVSATQLRDRTENTTDPNAIHRLAPATHYGLPLQYARNMACLIQAAPREVWNPTTLT